MKRKGVTPMGIKHGREYGDILKDLTEAVSQIPDSYIFFEMEPSEWSQLLQEQKDEVWEALAEDLFYALGTQPMIEVGSAIVTHDVNLHRINLFIGDQEFTSVRLV